MVVIQSERRSESLSQSPSSTTKSHREQGLKRMKGQGHSKLDIEKRRNYTAAIDEGMIRIADTEIEYRLDALRNEWGPI